MIKKLSDIIERTKLTPKKKLVLVNGEDEHSLEAVYKAIKLGITDVIVTGREKKIILLCKKLDINYSLFRIIDAKNEDDALEVAMLIIKQGEADFIMKGLISTDRYMKAILDKRFGLLSSKSVLSHVAVIENPSYHKLLFVSDVAVIPYPGIRQKSAMISYLAQVALSFGITTPRIALIAPTEKILEGIPACVDSVQLVKMANEGEFPGAVIDGPMAFDVAVDAHSAKMKNIVSPVAGNADCLLFSNIDAANVFYKVNTKFCHAEHAAVAMGAKIPVVLSSRGDSVTTKFYSIALASLMCN